jgi:uncharacterized protein YukE
VTGFAVDESALEVFAGRLELLALGVPTARGYLERHVDVSFGDTGLALRPLDGAVRRLSRSVGDALTAVEASLTGSAARLRQAGLTYRRADDELDQVIRAVGAPLVPLRSPERWWRGSGGRQGDSRPPVAELSEPTVSQPMPSLIQEMLAIQDKVSLAWALNFIVDHVCGVNPFEEGAKFLAGDYEGFSRAGDAVTRLGQYFGACAEQIRASAAEPAASWIGEAADAAQKYFVRLVGGLTELQTSCASIGKELQQVATSIYFLGQGFASFLQELADIAIAAGLVALAGTATAETGVGPVLAVAAEAYLAWEARQAWIKAMAYHGRAVMVGQGVVGLMGSFLMAIERVAAGGVPGAYRGVEVP